MNTIVCAPNHQDPIVPFQSVNLVEEKAFDVIRHQAVYVFKNEETWAGLPRLLEDRADVIVIGQLAERLDV